MNNKEKREKLEFVEACCEEILDSSKRSTDAKKEYKAVNRYLEDIRRIRQMDPEKKEELCASIRRIESLREDKNAYQSFGTKIPDDKFHYIQQNEDKMQEILKEIHEDETYMQSTKTNIHHIEGEKAGLIYERKDCERKMKYIRNAAMFVLAILAVTLGVMFYFHLNTDYDFTIGISASVTVAVAMITGLIVLYRRKVMEIRLNEKKMQKTVGLLNKHRLLYVNVKNRLDYTYKKIKIRNSYELSNYWRLYLTAKKEQQVCTRLWDELYKEHQKVEDLLKQLELSDESMWNSQLNAMVDENVMDELEESLNKQKKGLRKTLDYSRERIQRCKNMIKDITEKDPDLLPEILQIVETRENSI